MSLMSFGSPAYDRILKFAPTIADWESSDRLTANYLSEAMQYRSLDRQIWA